MKIRDSKGQSLIEYSLLIGVLLLAAFLTTYPSIRGKVKGYFTVLNTQLPTTSGNGGGNGNNGNNGSNDNNGNQGNHNGNHNGQQ